jgi:hypothetical protein
MPPAPRLPLALLVTLVPCACGDNGEVNTTGTTGMTTATSSTSSATTTTGELPTTTGTSSDESTSDPSTSGSTGDITTGASGSTSTGEPPAAGAWIERFGAPDDLHANGLGFGPAGELWVAGDFFGALDLGSGPLPGMGTGVYLGKFAVDGATLHARALFPASGEATLTQVTGLAVDSTGAVIVSGWLEGSYEIGGEVLVADELDVFVGKWDSDGAPVWGRKFGAVDWQVGEALAVAADDTIWLAGATLAPFTVDDLELTGTASTGMFAVRLAADGQAIAGAWWGDAGNQEIRSIAACPDGSAAIAGFFDAPLAFADDSVEPVGDKDLFVARIDAQAAPLWLAAYGSASTDHATDVTCGIDIAFAGAVTGAAQFGDLEVTPSGDADLVLARLDLGGALLWATAITGPEDQLPTGLAARPDGSVSVTLRSAGTATLGDAEHTAAGASDIVYAAYPAAADSPSRVIGLGDVGPDGAGPLALGPDGAAALTGTISGTVTWPGLPPVTAAGPADLVLVRFTPDE